MNKTSPPTNKDIAKLLKAEGQRARAYWALIEQAPRQMGKCLACAAPIKWREMHRGQYHVDCDPERPVGRCYMCGEPCSPKAAECPDCFTKRTTAAFEELRRNPTPAPAWLGEA